MKKHKIRLAAVWKHIDLPSVQELAAVALDAADGNEDEAVDDLAVVLDDLIDWSRVIPAVAAPAGVVLEALDRALYCRPIARAVVKALAKKRAA